MKRKTRENIMKVIVIITLAAFMLGIIANLVKF